MRGGCRALGWVLVLAGPLWGQTSRPAEGDDPGPVCTSCSEAVQTYVPPLSCAEFEALLGVYAEEGLEAPGPALESLLYHGVEVRAHLEHEDLSGLDAAHEALLREALRTTHAVVAFRVYDASGALRMELAPTRVEIGERLHLHASAAHGIQPAEFSGTVIRVGLSHLWSRY